MTCAKSQSLSLLSILGGTNGWKVVRVGRKTTTKVKVREGIGF